MTKPITKIAETIDYLVAHAKKQPDLNELADRAGYEAMHFQKLFKTHVGISPKRLVQYMNMRHARELLVNGATTLETAYAAGLSGNSRLHDLFVQCEGVTPGQVQGRGRDLRILYGFYATPLGEMLVAKTERGVCYVGFLMDQARAAPLRKMQAHWPLAELCEDEAAVASEAEHILQIWRGQGEAGKKLKLDLHGTNFQIQVWQALLKIPAGETVTYGDIGGQIGRPKSSRAIGNAVGANPVSLLIPCHRVIRSTGIIDNYGWGSPRKKLILGMEGAMDAED